MKHTLLYVALFLIIGVAGMLYSEKIPVNDGAGWDGNIYLDYARNLPSAIQKQEINQYYFQRILPSAIVYGIAQGLSVVTDKEYAFSIPVLIQLFAILNLIALLICVFIVGRLSDFLGYDGKRKMLLMIFFFLNFFILKITFFYPVLTDIPALLIAVLLTDAWFRRNNIQLFIFGITGFFVFPGLFPMAILMWLAPRHDSAEKNAGDNLKWIWIVAYSFVMAAMLYFSLTTGIEVAMDLHRTNKLLLIPSVLLMWGYLFLIVSRLKITAVVTNAWQTVPWKKMIIAVGIFLLLKIFIHLLLPSAVGYSFREFVYVVSYNAFANPLVYLVAHGVYFGMIVIFVIVYFKVFLEKINFYGGALQWLIVILLLFSINSESRQLLIFLPIVAIVVADVAGSAGWSKTIPMILLTAVNFIVSKCWMSFHAEQWTDNIHKFPAQYYFMNFGPWISNEMYYLQGGIFTVLLIVAAWVSKKYFSFNRS